MKAASLGWRAWATLLLPSLAALPFRMGVGA